MTNKEHHKWHSDILGHEFNINVYGTSGRPCIVFPSSEGHFHDFEAWGMVDVSKDFLEKKQIRLFCVDAIDEQSLFNKHNHVGDRAWRQRQYEDCIIKEVVPWVKKFDPDHKGGIMATGCSWGGYHSINFILKYPEIFNTCIALSGVYNLQFLLGDYVDEHVYHSDPLKYLPGLTDPKVLDQLKKHTIVIAVGQGAWEAESVRDSHAVANLLQSKGVNVWLDVWGHDVAHDWYWWRKMLPYHLDKVLNADNKQQDAKQENKQDGKQESKQQDEE